MGRSNFALCVVGGRIPRPVAPQNGEIVLLGRRWGIYYTPYIVPVIPAIDGYALGIPQNPHSIHTIPNNQPGLLTFI